VNLPPSHTNGIPDAQAPLHGVEGLTCRNEARLIWWAIRSRLHGTGGWRLAVTVIATATLSAWIIRQLGTGAAVATFVAVLVVYVVAFVAAVQLLINTRRRRQGWIVGYFTEDASQLVHPGPARAWVLSDHFARRRGHGLAACSASRCSSTSWSRPTGSSS